MALGIAASTYLSINYTSFGFDALKGVLKIK